MYSLFKTHSLKKKILKQYGHVCFCLFWSISYQSTIFLSWTSTKQRIKCLGEGHNTVTSSAVSLKLANLRCCLMLYRLSHCAPHEHVVCLFDLIFYVPVNNFQLCLDGTSTKQRIKCLAQLHNTVIPRAVNLELATLRSPVYGSTNWATALRRNML